MHALITAGPTREPWDAIRFLSNAGTGRMGLEIARALRRRGVSVTVVLGPSPLSELTTTAQTEGVEIVSVTTAQEMLAAVSARFASCDLFVATASVVDFRPAHPFDGKLKKDGSGKVTLELVANPDILAEMGARRTDAQTLVGFALEVADGENHARQKLRQKNCDLIVWNSPDNLGDQAGSLNILTPTGTLATLTPATKADSADQLVDLILQWRQDRA